MNNFNPQIDQSVYEYNLEKVLSVHKDAFARDFTFMDLASLLKQYNLFNDAELKSIYDIKNEDERIDKLFFLIVYKNKNVNEFLRLLKLRYQWLADKLKEDLDMLNSMDIQHENYFNKMRQLRKEIPRHIDYNVHRCEWLFNIKQSLLSLASQEYLVIHGRLAYGKRWLAMDACCNYSVMHAMSGNIFWINCSKCKTPDAILQCLQELAITANVADLIPTNHKDISSKIQLLTRDLRYSFQKTYLQNCLIVLIDVQTYETLKAFDLNCKTMVTTGNKWILEKLSNSTIKIELSSGFTRDEALELFSKILDQNVADLPSEACELYMICKRNPFLLSLVANNLKEYKAGGIILWEQWIGKMKNHNSTQYREVKSLIDQSLKELKTEYKDLFHSLVIFPDGVNIPLRVLELYWNRKKTVVEEIIRKLDKLYLVEMRHSMDGDLFCHLHYFYYSYLANEVISEDKLAMHQTLVQNYRILDALAARTEPDISDLPDDKYFHFFIGYHLKEGNIKDIFPKLYFDFGFLEQKLRSTGLPNLLGDLDKYKSEITGNDQTKLAFLQDLTEFLKTIEELIIKSMDTCLLQYAITTDTAVRLEALKQARMFPHRIWFNGIDHSYKHRQIVRLPRKPHLVRFVEPDASLIAFSDHSIMLTDMSSQYTVEPTLYTGHETTIVNLQVFLVNYFISLDASGLMKVWQYKETPVARRRRSNRESDDEDLRARQNINPECFGVQNATKGTCLQTIENRKKGDRNLCFLILTMTRDSDLRMFVATDSGFIATYQWNEDNERFEYRNSESFDTKFPHIKELFFVPKMYLMALNSYGTNAFFNLKNHSQLPRSRKMDLSIDTPIGIHRINPRRRNTATVTQTSIFAIVYCNRIFKVTVSVIANIMSPEQCVFTLSDEDQNFITCSTVTEDNEYLILGTKKGIIVYDVNNEHGREILRSSISDNITCIDVCQLDDITDEFKYVIISATKKGGAAIYMHGILFEHNTMKWVSNRMGSPINENNLNGRESLNGYLIGGKLFDVVEDPISSTFKLLAGDSSYNVHYKNSLDRFVQSAIERMSSKITAISVGLNSSFIACENGCVYRFEEKEPFMFFHGAVKFLKYYEELDVVVAATQDLYQIWVRGAFRLDEERISPPIIQSFLYNGRFILLVKEDCSIDIFNVERYTLTSQVREDVRVSLGGCDLSESTLIIGTSRSVVHEYSIQFINNEKIRLVHVRERDVNKFESMASLAYTANDKSILAVGYKSGLIEVYDCHKDKIQLLQKLVSHEEMIYSLKFSPLMDNQTLILLSMSEVLCFWNITHILNNPLDGGNVRRSQRFNRRRSKSSVTSANDLSPSPSSNDITANGNGGGTTHLTINGYSSTNGNTNGHSNDIISPISQLNQSFSNLCLDTIHSHVIVPSNGNSSPWTGKMGASTKPELLSCIKFIGNSAEKIFVNETFSKFITIDSEGEIYYMDVNFHDDI